MQTGLDITRILSAKKKVEAKRRRHEKKEAKRAKKDAKKNQELVRSTKTTHYLYLPVVYAGQDGV